MRRGAGDAAPRRKDRRRQRPGWCGARGRGYVIPALGLRRAPPGGTMAPCEELADGGRLGRPGGFEARSAHEGSAPEEPNGTPRARAESAARRRSENAAMERREAPASFTRGCGKTEDWCATRRSIPSALCREEMKARDDGLPGAAKNTGDDARLRQTARTLPGSPNAHSSALRFHFASLAAAS